MPHKQKMTVALALLTVSVPSALAGEVADEAGKIEPGLFWDYITAAYVVTWLALIGYTITLRLRQQK